MHFGANDPPMFSFLDDDVVVKPGRLPVDVFVGDTSDGDGGIANALVAFGDGVETATGAGAGAGAADGEGGRGFGGAAGAAGAGGSGLAAIGAAGGGIGDIALGEVTTGTGERDREVDVALLAKFSFDPPLNALEYPKPFGLKFLL